MFDTDSPTDICGVGVQGGTLIGMTNGEKIKATFPHYDIEIDELKGYVRIFYENFYTTYPWNWWNAEYKEPTTKKDLAVASYCKLVDCIDREYTAKYVEEFANNEYVSKEEADTFYLIADGIRHIPSVYPKRDDLIKANTQLKKELEMLKLDRDCKAEDCISVDVLNKAIDKVEDYVCNHEKNTYRAQGMCEALTMIEKYIKEHNNEQMDSRI